jgi:hypothetical protein
MPIACVFVCLALPGAVLLAPALVIAAVLRHGGRKRLATTVTAIPLGMIGLAAVFTVLGLVAAWLYGIRMSSHPDLLFERTFHFESAPETRALNGYCDVGSDYAVTAIKFRTTREVIQRITTNRFIPSDRKTCLWSHENGYSNLPARVLTWFLPPQESSTVWYSSSEFDGTFGHEEAILGYGEDTHTAYFYWCGVD